VSSASLKGKNPQSRVVALRGDMDALPIVEKNEVPYKSKMEGVMHACGHDVHTTCLLGAAKILAETKEEWEGTVKLIFQPGEEKNPGGASLLIKEDVLENPEPECIYALHVNPQLEVGKLSFRGGKVMASADEIYITVKGKGGHAAAPHLTADTILIASHLGGEPAADHQPGQQPVFTFRSFHYFISGRLYYQCHSCRSKADGYLSCYG
jgi:amidohydrolase